MRLGRGMELEKIVETVAKSYKHYGIAHIYKRATGMSITGEFIEQAGVDFNGLLAGGRYIGIETKQTSAQNFNLCMVHEHQINELRTIEKLGGLGFMLIRFTDTDEFFMIPLSYVEANLKGFKQREKAVRKKATKTARAKHGVKIVSEGIGTLNRADMIEQGFTIPKSKRHVYIDFLDGIA